MPITLYMLEKNKAKNLRQKFKPSEFLRSYFFLNDDVVKDVTVELKTAQNI